MSRFRVGDTLEHVQGILDGQQFVLEREPLPTKGGWQIWFRRGGVWDYYYEEWFRPISRPETINNEETTMSNVLQRVRDFAIGEPLKSYVKYGIKTKDGHLTEDGVTILNDILSEKFDAELQGVVKQLAADDRANKSK